MTQHRRMTPHQASQLMAGLVLAQTGWNDATVDATTEQIMRRWTNHDAADEAIRNVIDSWTGSGRPPWGVLHAAYRLAVRRRVMDVKAVTTGSGSGRIVSVREGREIAARAYARECRSRDSQSDPHIRSGWRTAEPNPDYLDAMLGTNTERQGGA